MADRPIPFKAPMIRALLDGRKTQTRRVLKNPEYYGCPTGDCPHMQQAECDAAMQETALPDVQFKPGDRLWVREAWRTNAMWDHMTPAQLGTESQQFGRVSVLFEAGGALSGSVDASDAGRYRHARFMPRWASRLTLLVTDVRVQRLQDISGDDCIAEGVQYSEVSDLFHVASFESDTPGGAFESLWNSINGPGAWDENPWVAAISFDVVKANIDQVQHG